MSKNVKLPKKRAIKDLGQVYSPPLGGPSVLYKTGQSHTYHGKKVTITKIYNIIGGGRTFIMFDLLFKNGKTSTKEATTFFRGVK